MTTERVLLPGATGFVGGNVAAVLTEPGADVVCAVRRDPGPAFPWPWRMTDLGDQADVGRALAEHSSTAVLHLAIDNDLQGLYRDRRAGFDAYVGMTPRVVDAANAHGAQVGHLSTDWVFDGTQDDSINGVASPVTAAEIGARLLLALEKRADGVLHVVGATAVTRTGLAQATCETFGLDASLLHTGPLTALRREVETGETCTLTGPVTGPQPGSATVAEGYVR